MRQLHWIGLGIALMAIFCIGMGWIVIGNAADLRHPLQPMAMAFALTPIGLAGGLGMHLVHRRRFLIEALINYNEVMKRMLMVAAIGCPSPVLPLLITTLLLGRLESLQIWVNMIALSYSLVLLNVTNAILFQIFLRRPGTLSDDERAKVERGRWEQSRKLAKLSQRFGI